MRASGGDDDEGSRKMEKIAEIQMNQFQQLGGVRRGSERE